MTRKEKENLTNKIMPEKNTDSLVGKIEEFNETLDLEEKNPDYKNIENDLEKGIVIRVMPKKFKVSANGSGKSNKAVGALIIIVGILVMIAAVYIGYVYLINPRGASVGENINVSPSVLEEEVEKDDDNENFPVEEDADIIEEDLLGVSEEKEDEWVSSSTSTPVDSASSTSLFASSTSEVSTSTESVETKTISGADADSDGLTDAEEAVLGTNPLKADSDEDTYGDLSELLNGYNPSGSGKLSENKNLSVYRNGISGYSVLVPTAWSIKETGGGSSVIFSSAGDSFFQITADQNISGDDILAWYGNLFPEESISADSVISKNGWQGIYSADKKAIYLTDEEKIGIYSLSYSPDETEEDVYGNIFQIFVSSFNL
jgi:hypothetical protein